MEGLWMGLDHLDTWMGLVENEKVQGLRLGWELDPQTTNLRANDLLLGQG